jgi:hypothetical protein
VREGRKAAVGNPQRSRPPDRRLPHGNAGATEAVVTEFLILPGVPVVDSEPLGLVRVELPAGAALALGLPIDEDRVGGWVSAEVLVGEDGLARAIRFVK